MWTNECQVECLRDLCTLTITLPYVVCFPGRRCASTQCCLVPLMQRTPPRTGRQQGHMSVTHVHPCTCVHPALPAGPNAHSVDAEATPASPTA